jgi:uncharacterized cupin superfamily protein
MKKPVNEAELAWEVFAAGTREEVRFKALCDMGGRAKVGVALMELPAKCDTSPAHWHSLEEEHLYVLAGRATLHLGGERLALVPGSYVCFPAGQAVTHMLENTGTEPFRYLMIGERIAGDQVNN